MNNTPGAAFKFTPAKTKPIVIEFDRVLYVDVDDTLVTFDYPQEYADKTISVGPNGFLKQVLPMTKNIEKMKNARVRGHGVVVWSQGGYAWAESVIKALALEAYVDLIITKPSWIYDDLPVEAWMGPRFFTPEFEK